MHVGDVSIDGDLTVTTLIATTTITTGDNCITLNDDVTGAPTEDAGFEIVRGTSLNAELKWNEAADRFQAGEAGALSNIVREVDLTSLDASVTIVGSDFSVNFPVTTDNKVSVSPDDTTPGFLEDKLTAGTGIILTEINGGGNENLEVSVDPAEVAQNAFTTVTTPLGTSPLADGPTDTLNFLSSDSSVLITGAQGADSVDFVVDTSIIDHTDLLNIGVNTHAQIDTHLASTANPHSVTFTQSVAADAGTDITAAEAETLSDNSNADGLHFHTQAALAGIKEVMYRAIGVSSTYENYHVGSIGANGSINISFEIPFDFVSLNFIAMILAPTGNAGGVGKDVDLFSDYGAPGESVTNHSESDVASTYDFGTADFWVAVNVSSVFSSIAANDQCGLEWNQNTVGGTTKILGVILNYTTA
jgi:hypothetical protein